MNNDLISRSELKKALKSNCKPELCHDYNTAWCESCCRTNDFEDLIDNAPTVEEKPHGEWVDEGQYAEGHSEHAYICKKCGYQIIENPNMIFENRFCKYCGADMRKGGAEE